MRFTAQRGTLDKSVDWGSGSFETWLFEKFQISNYRNIDYSKRTWRSNYLKCRIFEKAEDQVTRNIYYSKTSHRVKRLLGMARAFVWSRNQSIAPFFFDLPFEKLDIYFFKQMMMMTGENKTAEIHEQQLLPSFEVYLNERLRSKQRGWKE